MARAWLGWSTELRFRRSARIRPAHVVALVLAIGAFPAGPAHAQFGRLKTSGYGKVEAEALGAFQQEMMEVALAASAGDATAKARLDAWQALTVKHEAEIRRLGVAAEAGDTVATQKLQLMQLTIMKEWQGTGGPRSRLKRSTRP